MLEFFHFDRRHRDLRPLYREVSRGTALLSQLVVLPSGTVLT
jgi:hypothetical protein